MPYYANPGPSRDEVDAMTGLVVLEFGTGWCGHCQGAAPLFAGVLAAHPDVRHLGIEDGSGRKLGRSFGIKLWPTFVFLHEGREVARLVRPRDPAVIESAFETQSRCQRGSFDSRPETSS